MRAYLHRAALMIIAFLDHSRRHSVGVRRASRRESSNQGGSPRNLLRNGAHPAVYIRRPMHDQSRIDRSIVLQRAGEQAIDQSTAAGRSRNRGDHYHTAAVTLM